MALALALAALALHGGPSAALGSLRTKLGPHAASRSGGASCVDDEACQLNGKCSAAYSRSVSAGLFLNSPLCIHVASRRCGRSNPPFPCLSPLLSHKLWFGAAESTGRINRRNPS